MSTYHWSINLHSLHNPCSITHTAATHQAHPIPRHCTQTYTLHIRYIAHKAFLHRELFPYNAHRGLFVQPTVCKLLTTTTAATAATANDRNITSSPGNRNKFARNPHKIVAKEIFIISAAMPIVFPSPDFSMPFNVIILTSTCMTFLLGSIMSTILKTTTRVV